MQLTKFDRWLRETFVYQTRIHTLRRPAALPKGIREIPAHTSGRYKHLYLAATGKAAQAFIRSLKEENQMYHTEVFNRKSWYVRFLAPETKSVTWWVIGTLIIAIAIAGAGLYIRDLSANPEFRRHFSEALEILKG
ncbi:MAG: hypothetical protein V4733_09895 [Verrucomicrobiota bacterium]